MEDEHFYALFGIIAVFIIIVVLVMTLAYRGTTAKMREPRRKPCAGKCAAGVPLVVGGIDPTSTYRNVVDLGITTQHAAVASSSVPEQQISAPMPQNLHLSQKSDSVPQKSTESDLSFEKMKDEFMQAIISSTFDYVSYEIVEDVATTRNVATAKKLFGGHKDLNRIKLHHTKGFLVKSTDGSEWKWVEYLSIAGRKIGHKSGFFVEGGNKAKYICYKTGAGEERRLRIS